MKNIIVLIRLMWESVRDRKQFESFRKEWRPLAPDKSEILREAEQRRLRKNGQPLDKEIND